MSTSQNGYPVLFDNRTTGGLPRLRMWQIPGADRHVYLRDGSAGFLLTHVATWWHENIHPIDVGIWDEWGWAVRPVRGQTSGYSNHASGTAIDIDATRHPRGVERTRNLTAAQIDKIHAQLRKYDGAIRWGGDYTSTVDAMHFEINLGLVICERIALRLTESGRGQEILAANPGAWDVISSGTSSDGKPQPGTTPAPTPEPVPAATGPAFTVGHVSGLWSAGHGSWEVAGENMLEAGASVITWTETVKDGLIESVARNLGLHVARLDTVPGESECAVTWLPKKWESAADAYAVPLATQRFKTSKGFLRPPVTAVVKTLQRKGTNRRVIFGAKHDPSGIEGHAGPSGTTARLRAADQVTAGTHEIWGRARAQFPDAARVLTSDFNRDWRLRWVQDWFGEEFPVLRSCWEGNVPKRGTHGDRVIDWIAAAGVVTERAHVLAAVKGFDHKPIVARLRWPA